jgi:hypothetical protein
MTDITAITIPSDNSLGLSNSFGVSSDNVICNAQRTFESTFPDLPFE